MTQPAKIQFELIWVDAALHDAKGALAVHQFERSRCFQHKGAAIAWGRRHLFQGRVFGDCVEMRAVHPGAEYHGGEAPQVVVMTLGGFCKLRSGQDIGRHGTLKTILERPQKQCNLT